MHIDKHQLSATHGPVKTPITTEPRFLPNCSRPKPQTETGKKENLFSPDDGDIHCMTRSSTQPRQPKVPDMNHPCACRLNSHPQTTKDSEKYCAHIDPHPSQGLHDEVCDIQRAYKVPGYLKSSHLDHRHTEKPQLQAQRQCGVAHPQARQQRPSASRNHDVPAKSYAPIPTPKEPISLGRPQKE